MENARFWNLRAGSPRRLARVFEVSLLAAGLSVAAAVPPAGCLALPPIGPGGFAVDFGPVVIGNSNVQTLTVPLVVHLSDLPPDFAVYSGGLAPLDQAIADANLLGIANITVPITVAELITLVGDVGVSYALNSLTLDQGTNFLLDPGDCINTSGPTCTGSLTFAPLPGSRVSQFVHDVLRGQIGGVVFSGGNGQLSNMLNLLSPVVVSELDSFFVVRLEGTPFPAPATVSIPTLGPAALAGLTVALALVGMTWIRR